MKVFLVFVINNCSFSVGDCGVRGGGGGGGGVEMTMGERWLYEVRIIHYILAFSHFFSGNGVGALSDSYNHLALECGRLHALRLFVWLQLFPYMTRFKAVTSRRVL